MKPHIAISHIIADDDQHIGARLGSLVGMTRSANSKHAKVDQQAQCRSQVFHDELRNDGVGTLELVNEFFDQGVLL